MDIVERIHFAKILRQELKAIKDRAWVIETEMVPPSESKHPEPDPKLEASWGALFANLPQIEPSFLNTINLDRKVTLIQWISRLAPFFKGKILGRPYNSLLPSDRLEAVLIWGRTDKWYLSEEFPEYQGDTYWYTVFRNLEEWRVLTQAILEEVNWNINQDKVELIFRWAGSFKSFDELEIEGPKSRFWTVSLIDDYISKQNTVRAVSSLLNAQVGIQHGLSSYLPVNIDGKEFTTSLKIPRADRAEAQEIISTPSRTNVQQIVDFLIALAHPHYLEASRQLEVEIDREIAQWQARDEAKWKFAAKRLQEDVLGQLISIRQTFFGD